uniref:Xylulose kinase-1 n=1 Tax=Tanacetum cinerariifolium TaxID=118510 RepID=A0A6L2LCK4_TANCI|nr:hypothetical protein [Tanacetum cinerariifolium]
MKAKIEEEERIAREKDEANIAVIKECDDVQATIDVDRQRKYFAAKRAEEIRNKLPTKAQQTSLMCTYMKNIKGYKQKDFKGKSIDAIKKMFDKVYKRVNTFVAMDSEVIEGSKKTQVESSKPIIMSSPKFAETHNLVAFLEKPTESNRFKHIVNFLNANRIKYALTVSPTIYTSCIKQFWTSAKVKTVNDDVRLQAVVDGKNLIVNEASIRRDLRLDDAEGTACLPNDPIFEGLARMGGEDRLQLNELMDICIKLSNMVLSLEQTKTNQAAKIEKLKKRVKKLEGKKKKRTHGLKRLYKERIAENEANEDLFLIDETTQDQGRIKDQDLFGVHDLNGDEVFMDITNSEDVEQDATVAKSVKGIAATTLQISKDELTLPQTLIEIKAAKPKAKGVTIQKPNEFRTTSPPQPSQPPQAKDKGKEIMLKREQLSIEERYKLLAELIESRRKYFTAKRAEAIRNKTPIKAQQKSLMCTYMKNIEGFKQKDFKGKNFDDIKKMFDKVYKRVNTFMDMNTEYVEECIKKTQVKVTEGGSKRAGKELEQEKLKRCLEIVPEDDDDVSIEATPLSSKSPTIVDYKIYREGKKSYFKIIRADGNSQNYLTFGTMFKNFNREDLEVLRSIIKERFKKTKLVDDMDNISFQTLKTMFEPHVEDIIWKYQQGAVKVNNRKLFDSYGMYCVTTKNMVYCLPVEKMYPFTNSILH